MNFENMYRVIREYLLVNYPLKMHLTLEGVMNFGFENGFMGREYRCWRLATLPECRHYNLDDTEQCRCFFYLQKDPEITMEKFKYEEVQYYNELLKNMVEFLQQNNYVKITDRGCNVLDKLIYVSQLPESPTRICRLH